MHEPHRLRLLENRGCSVETGVEILATTNQLAGQRFDIRQLAEDNGTSKQAIGVVLGIPLASTPTTLNLKVQNI